VKTAEWTTNKGVETADAEERPSKDSQYIHVISAISFGHAGTAPRLERPY
jgi:hypothetical protein